MNFYKITFGANCCSYDNECVYASEKTYEEVDKLVHIEADNRACVEYFVEEISEEEYKHLKKYDYLGNIIL